MLIRPVPVAIVEDHALFRKTLQNYLSVHNVDVIIQASDIAELFQKLQGSTVEIVLMDLFMPGLNGIDAIRSLRAEFPHIKIVVVSMSTDMDLISELLEEGIHGYLSKADEPDNLLQAISAASEGRIFRNRLLTEALYWNKQNHITTFTDPQNITLNDREKKILQLIWEEKSNKEIADELFLGVRSVEKIRQDIKEKVGVKSTVGMLKYAISKRIISIDARFSGLPS